MDLTLVNIDYQNVVGLFSIAGYLRSKGFSVEIIDGPVEHIKKELYRRKGSLSLIGFSAVTCSINAAAELCAFVKRDISSSIICVIGGFHASALPKETLLDFQFDIAVIGEGEITIEEILNAHKSGSTRPYMIKGTVERYKDDIILNGQRELIPDLDTLSYPAYDMVDFDYYARGGLETRYKNKYPMTILLSRGCPFNCIFCCSKNIWKSKVRTYSSEYALGLIELLIKRYGVSFINFLDDDFFARKSFFIPFMEGFIRRGFHKKIRWSCQATSKNTAYDNLILAKRGGCVLVRYGFESFYQPILDFIKQSRIRVEDHYSAIDNCIHTGMPFFGSFIVGSPMETIESIMVNINVMQKYPFRLVDTCLLTPFPGTPLWDRAIDNGRVNNRMNWNNFNTVRALLKYDNFTNKQMEAIREYIVAAISYSSYVGKKPLSINHEDNIRKIQADDYSVIPRRPGYSIWKTYPDFLKIIFSPRRIRSLFKRKLLLRIKK